jgi:hypothetical protein
VCKPKKSLREAPRSGTAPKELNTMSNRYKPAKQSLPIFSWTIGLSVAACIVCFFIKFLLMKYQVFQGGKNVKELENRLSRLHISNEDLQAKVDMLTARPELKKKHAAGIIKLREISDAKDVIYSGREDRRVEWKEGVATLISGRPGSVAIERADDEDGGTR